MVKRTVQPAPAPATQTVRITRANVWGRDVKFFLEDIVEVDNELAGILIECGGAKATKDDPTVGLDKDNNRVEI